jgi:outer membrane protein TolC
MVALARSQSELAKVRVQVGTGQRVELAKAALELQELEAELAKAELDLALVRQQIAQRPAQR